VDDINSAVRVVTGTNKSIKDVSEITWNKVFDIETMFIIGSMVV